MKNEKNIKAFLKEILNPEDVKENVQENAEETVEAPQSEK